MTLRKERREFLRRDCLMVCRCEGDRFRFNGHIVDVSYGGAGIVETKKLPAQGTELLVTILLPWRRVELPSRVVWVNSEAKRNALADLGVQFLDTLSVRQDELAEFFPHNSVLEE
jgi:hypothetical protein